MCWSKDMADAVEAMMVLSPCSVHTAGLILQVIGCSMFKQAREGHRAPLGPVSHIRGGWNFYFSTCVTWCCLLGCFLTWTVPTQCASSVEVMAVPNSWSPQEQHALVVL